METKLAKLPQSQVEISFEVGWSEFEIYFFRAIERLAREMILPGFRPGKIPPHLIREKLGDFKILEKAAELAIGELYGLEVKKKNLSVIGIPTIKVEKMAYGNPFIFKAISAILPKVTLGDYQRLKVKRKKIIIKKEEIERVLTRLCSERAKEIRTERETLSGDKVKLDFNIYLDQVLIEGGEGRDVEIILGEGKFMPDFEKKLIGLRPGQTKEFTLTYPADYFQKNLRGKKAECKVALKEIYQRELPLLSDEFARSVGQFKDLAGLREAIQKNLGLEAEIKEEQKLESEILEEIINNSQFDELPELVIKNEMQGILHELEDDLKRQNLTMESYLSMIKKTKEELEKDFLPLATKRIKSILILKEIAKKEKIQVEAKELERELIKIKDIYQHDKDFLEDTKGADYQRYFKGVLLNQKVINWLKNFIK